MHTGRELCEYCSTQALSPCKSKSSLSRWVPTQLNPVPTRQRCLDNPENNDSENESNKNNNEDDKIESNHNNEDNEDGDDNIKSSV